MSASAAPKVRFRTAARPSDVAALRKLVVVTGVFHPAERAIAVELLTERLKHGAKSGYWFFFAERGGQLAGYCAWGRVPLTKQSYDLYWIAVDPACQGQGVGQALLALVERAVARRGGGGLYIETSSRPAYARTRRFYRDAGYRRVARLRDFYAPADDKIVFCKVIPSERRSRGAGADRSGAPR